MLVSLKEITNCEDYYIDDTTFQVVSFKYKKYTEGRILKPKFVNGYIRYAFQINGKQKQIRLHHIIVKLFIDKNFDSNKFDVDHKNHNRQDNSIDNLCIVSRIENNRNTSKSRTGKEIDHKDRNPKNNSIENLAIVSRSENIRNVSKSRTGTEFNFVNDIGNALIINSEAQIYYSLDFDKFYMKITQSGKFKELHMCFKNGKYPCIRYQYNNKQHYLNIDKFKKSLKQQQ